MIRNLYLSAALIPLVCACAAPNEYSTYETNKIYTHSKQDAGKDSFDWQDLQFWRDDVDDMEQKNLVIEEPVMHQTTPPEPITIEGGRS
jgi:hypothetical protein